MNTTAIVSLVLGAGGGLSGMYAFLNNIRDRRSTVRKQEGDIQLTVEQRNKIAAEAAQINSLAVIAQQDWWRKQFEEVKRQLEEEQQYCRKIVRYIRNHEPWDELAEAKLAAANIPMPPKPRLDPEFSDSKD